MPWLDRPAAVYTRYEVVLHRMDDPLTLTYQNPVSGQTAAYEVWELRIVYVFDASVGRWEIQSSKPFGYRRGVRNGPKIEVETSSMEIRNLALHYAPSWIPDPSKPKMNLPAEDVWDEAMAWVVGDDAQQAGLTTALKGSGSMVGIAAAGRDANPYRGA